MKDDDFERILTELARRERDRNRIGGWKREILAHVRREARMTPKSGGLPPRALVIAWAAAWVTIALMSLSTPRTTDSAGASNVAAGAPNSGEEGVLTASSALAALDRPSNIYAGDSLQ